MMCTSRSRFTRGFQSIAQQPDFRPLAPGPKGALTELLYNTFLDLSYSLRAGHMSAYLASC